MGESNQLAKNQTPTNDQLALTAQSGLPPDQKIDLTHLTMNQLNFIGKAMAASGAFNDIKTQSQALVKILAGQEMGMGPFAAMSNINIINGSPAVGGHIMAARVKASGKYDYQVVKWEKDICSIDFYQNGKKIGNSTFDKSDATAAGLLNKDNWRKFPRNMYFNRAISNGVRTYCPDVLGNAPVYDPDELGAKLNEQGNVIALPVNSVATAKVPEPVVEPEPPVDEPVDNVDNFESEDDEVPIDDEVSVDKPGATEQPKDKMPAAIYGPRPESNLPRPQQREYYKKLLKASDIQPPEAKQIAQQVVHKIAPATYDDFEACIAFINTGLLPGQTSLVDEGNA